MFKKSFIKEIKLLIEYVVESLLTTIQLQA